MLAGNRDCVGVHINADDAMEAQMHVGSVILAIWLVIGGIAAGDNSRRPSQLHGREPGYQLHGAAP